MNSAQLLAQFDRLIEGPEAIARLRRFILDLAVRGKLVEQTSDEEPASEVLKMILAERNRNPTDKKHRKFDAHPIRGEEIPFHCSNGTVCARLASVAHIEKGCTGIQKASPGPYPLVTLAEERATSSEFQFDTAAAIVPLISSTGHGHASLKRMHFQEGKFALGNILCAVMPFVPNLLSARYLYEYLWAYREPLLVEKMSGTANVSLTIGKVGEAPVPIITPRSQARLHELMQLCDQLNAAQREREERRDRLNRASLYRVNIDADAFRDHARFYLRHLPRLTARLEHIQDLRQAILNLAVRGKLVPQQSSDEPANIVLDRIASEKNKNGRQRAASAGRIVRQTDLTASLPTGWRLAALAEVALDIVDCPHSTPKWTNAGKICVRTNQFRPGSLDLSTVRFVSEATFKERIKRLKPASNDILYSREGGILGVACRVPKDVELCLGQRMMLIRPPSAMNSAYLELVLNSPVITEIARGETTGSAAPRVNVATVTAYPIPVAPLAEQHRIVAKVDELMKLCDQLESQLTTTQTESRRLLEAILHEALQAGSSSHPELNGAGNTTVV